jgi:hypothetical protein
LSRGIPNKIEQKQPGSKLDFAENQETIETIAHPQDPIAFILSENQTEISGTIDLSRLGNGERFACRESDSLNRGKHLARAGAPLGEARGPQGPNKRERVSPTFVN